jgi:hypothetical protein
MITLHLVGVVNTVFGAAFGLAGRAQESIAAMIATGGLCAFLVSDLSAALFAAKDPRSKVGGSGDGRLTAADGRACYSGLLLGRDTAQ